ncbi:hypothetical protein ACIQKB_00320 [Streptomyces sp. NPDC092046]|uniref:hypothetical protein n=1 Tax=Streptomyces sp. NPDC092046 TaxID=3366009 RepID=UPI003819FF77
MALITAHPVTASEGRRTDGRMVGRVADPMAGRGADRRADRTGGRVAGATDGAPKGPERVGRSRRRQGRVLLGAGLVLLPWLGYLAGTLPPVEAAAWVTLDALEAAALLTAGSRLLTGDPRHRAPAAAAAALLLADACVDLATAAPGPELITAVAMAALAELPLAALCVTLAARGRGAGEER